MFDGYQVYCGKKPSSTPNTNYGCTEGGGR
jgi:hypothetical protein